MNHPIIVNVDLGSDETERLLEVLRRYLKALGYNIYDLTRINPYVSMHRIMLEEDSKASRDNQRRINPIMSEVVRKEVMELLNARIIYPISNSQWVSLIHVVPKKDKVTIVHNGKVELVVKCVESVWRICINCRKLNKATRKDYFSIPFIDQMLERLARHSNFYYLDKYFGFSQIPIHPDDQEKTMISCLYDIFSYRRMSFGLCNAPSTFQRCTMSTFVDF